MDNFGNPDVGTLSALYTQGEWIVLPFDGIKEQWSNDFGFINIYEDGHTEVWNVPKSAFTVNDIIGFAMFRGLIDLRCCNNCGEAAIYPQTFKTPCGSCGFWSGENR